MLGKPYRYSDMDRAQSSSYIVMQAYYMAAPFAVERAPTAALCCPLKHRTVHVALLKDYPVSYWSLASTLVFLLKCLLHDYPPCCQM